MSNKIETEILIHAVPERVWAVLMDFGAYPAWNPFILAIEGKAEPGETLRVTMRPPGGKAQSFKPKVLRADSPRSLRLARLAAHPRPIHRGAFFPVDEGGR